MKESITLKDVFAISERPSAAEGGRQERWVRIGIGFVNRDHSINVILDAIPLNGRLQIRDRQNKTHKGEPYEKNHHTSDGPVGHYPPAYGQRQGIQKPGRNDQR